MGMNTFCGYISFYTRSLETRERLTSQLQIALGNLVYKTSKNTVKTKSCSKIGNFTRFVSYITITHKTSVGKGNCLNHAFHLANFYRYLATES